MRFWAPFPRPTPTFVCLLQPLTHPLTPPATPPNITYHTPVPALAHFLTLSLAHQSFSPPLPLSLLLSPNSPSQTFFPSVHNRLTPPNPVLPPLCLPSLQTAQNDGQTRVTAYPLIQNRFSLLLARSLSLAHFLSPSFLPPKTVLRHVRSPAPDAPRVTARAAAPSVSRPAARRRTRCSVEGRDANDEGGRKTARVFPASLAVARPSGALGQRTRLPLERRGSRSRRRPSASPSGLRGGRVERSLHVSPNVASWSPLTPLCHHPPRSSQPPSHHSRHLLLRQAASPKGPRSQNRPRPRGHVLMPDATILN